MVQVYVNDNDSSMSTPVRELRAFRKVNLEPGESVRLTFELSREDLGHYSAALEQWVYGGGPCRIEIGSSSRDIRLSTTIDVPANRAPRPLTVWSTFGEWRNDAEAGPRMAELLETRGGIRGRIADLLKDETGSASILSFPLRALVEFPGFPKSVEDVELIVPSAN